MKIVFVSEVYPPYARGGAEFSTLYLLKNLKKSKIHIRLLTPNLGPSRYSSQSVQTETFPFYMKYKKNELPGNFTFTNPLWVIWAAFYYYRSLNKEKIDIIHVQGKYSIAPIIIANLFLKKKVVATIRDYQCICNYGMCLFTGEKTCNLKDYFFKDFPYYYQNYVTQKNFLSFIFNLVFACWGRLSKNLLKISLNRVSVITVMSKKEGEILKNNGIRPPTFIIRNSFVFPKKIIKKTIVEDIILYVGRLTVGKGVNLLLETISEASTIGSRTKFYFIGSGSLLGKLKEESKKNSHIRIFGWQDHDQLTKFYKKSTLVVVPSIWPEPLARVAIEALSNGTPVVVTKSGGMPEVIKNDKYGYVADKNVKSLTSALIKGITNNRKLRVNIKKDFNVIKKRFSTDVTFSHIDLYAKLIK